MNIFKFPLKQHIGTPSSAVVKLGDEVKRGSLIASKDPDSLGCNIYSSINGTVVGITETEIEIQQGQEAESTDYIKLGSGTPLALIEEAGLVGLGGAGFPTYAKLAKPLQKGGTIIINAAECEPILCHNIDIIEKNAEKVICGLETAMEIAKADRGVIAIKEYHYKAIEELTNKINNDDITIHPLIDMYPMGEERALIREVEDELLDVNQLPYEANCIVLNAETAYRISEAANEHKPLIDKSITVAGKLNDDNIQIFHDVPIGTKVGDLIEKAGGSSKEYGEVIMGGPFTGIRTDNEMPIIKTTGGILLTETFMNGPEKIGLLVCACGADKERLTQIAESMGSEVTGVEYCKQAQSINLTHKCENPGKCPGQVEKVLQLRKAGAQALLISNCTDCTNTVMSCAPQLHLPVYHCTDGALRAVNHKLIRKIKNEEVEVASK